MKTIVSLFKNRSFQKKLFFTLILLSVFELGSMITLPGINQKLIGSREISSFIQIINMIGAGSLDKFSLFALGVTPYITASIVIQLLSSDVIPYLSQLREQGIKGQAKLDRITRVFTMILAFVQAYGVCMMYGSVTSVSQGVVAQESMFTAPGISPILFVCFLMMAGTMISVWFGDLLTMYGLGNGVSMLICAGILMRLPNQLLSIFVSLTQGNQFHLFLLYMLSVLVLILFVVILQEAEIHIPIWDPSSRIQKINAKETNYLPLKVNTPGVMPIIFASSIMAVPIQLLQLFKQTEWLEKVSAFLSLQTWYSILIYAGLVLFFSFFYAKIQIDAEKVSENLTKRNCFIPGIQPGQETETYIGKTLNHIMVFGSIGLVMIAVIPYLLPMFTSLSSSTAIGGTSILIMVGVLMELQSQIKNLIQKDRYEPFRVKNS